MCGFAGFFPSISKEKDKNFINIMLKRILYRGPDNSSFYRNNKIALGHHRLSIIDLAGGEQPALDKITKDCLVFNGEIYGYKKHANHLKTIGISLKDSSDTEVLFKFLINFGIEETLKKIDGMFAYCIYDQKKKIEDLQLLHKSPYIDFLYLILLKLLKIISLKFLKLVLPLEHEQLFHL